MELGVDHHLTGGLVVPTAVVHADLSRAVIDAPFAIAEVRRGHHARGLDEDAFPFLHAGRCGAEHFGFREGVALAHDGRGDGVAVHALDLGQSEVLTDDPGQGHEVSFGHSDFRIESIDATVCTRAFLHAEQASVDAGHDAAHGHEGIGEDRRIEGLPLLDGRNGDGPVHDLTAVVVDHGVCIVVVGGRVGAAELLEITGIARFDAVAKASVDGASNPVAVAQHGPLFGVAVVPEVIHDVVAGSVVDGELSEVVDLARDGTRDLAQDSLVFLEVGVGRRQDHRCRQGVAAIENGGRGPGQLGAAVEAAHRALHENAVAEGHLRRVVEQAAIDVDEDAAPRAVSILDGGVAAVDPRHQAAHQHGLAVEGAVIAFAHILLDGRDGLLRGVGAAAIVKCGVLVVVGGTRIRAAPNFDAVEHALRDQRGNLGCRLFLSGIVVHTARGQRSIRIHGPVGTVPEFPVRCGRVADGVSVFEFVTGVGSVFSDDPKEVHDDALGIVEGQLIIAVAVCTASGARHDVRGETVSGREAVAIGRHIQAAGVVQRAVHPQVHLRGRRRRRVGVGPTQEVPPRQIEVCAGIVGDFDEAGGRIVRRVRQHVEVGRLGRSRKGQEYREGNEEGTHVILD